MTTSLKIIHWTPRILCMLAILFVSMFALDSFDPAYSLGHQLVAFLRHMIPSFILVVFLVIAWKWELIGGIILLAIALGFTPFIYMHNYAMNHSVLVSLSVILMINFPFMITGALFVLSHFLKRRHS
jgi:hypothetical protein